MRGFVPPQSDDEKLIVKRVRELATLSLEKGIVRRTAFLPDRQQQLAISALAGYQGFYKFYGGYNGAERQILFLSPFDEMSFDEEICCVGVSHAFSKTNEASLTHRDYLGAFLSLGLKRETVGDIVLSDNGCAVFALASAARLLKDELKSVGKYEMRAFEKPFDEIRVITAEPQIMSATIASLRLDAVLSAALKTSRSAAQQLIASKTVMVNHIVISSAHYDVQENDVFTVRGRGKFKLCEVGGKSRKDRIYIKYQIY